jgi:teichuronic acid biosynthesis glycosyltransferase TuaC
MHWPPRCSISTAEKLRPGSASNITAQEQESKTARVAAKANHLLMSGSSISPGLFLDACGIEAVTTSTDATEERLGRGLRVLMITTEWPTTEIPQSGVFVSRQAEFLRRAGAIVDIFHFRGKKRLVNYTRAWWKARRLIASGKYSLIHAQWGQSALLGLPKRLPLVVTFRGGDLEGIVAPTGRYTLKGRILRLLSRCVARIADQVIVVSETLAAKLPRTNCWVIPSGLNLDLFRPIPRELARERLGLPATGLLVLFASDPARPGKRYELARASVERLKNEFDVELLTTSKVPHDLMPLFMCASDVLVLTSTHEGSPNVVKEALACNLPIVSLAVGDVAARIGGVAGCVVCEDERPDTIAAALASVLRAGSRIDGRSGVLDLDEKTLADRVVSAYKEAILIHSNRRRRSSECV